MNMVLSMALLAVSFGASGQGTPADLHQVQAIVEGTRTPQHAHAAAIVLRQQPGVVMCRVDHNTRNLLMHVTPDCTLSGNTMQDLLAPLQMSLRCYERRPLVPGSFRHLDPRDCGIGPEAR